MTMRIELIGGPLHGVHWEERHHPMGPASVLKLRAPASGVISWSDPVEPVEPVTYVRYRLVRDESGSHALRYRYEPSAEQGQPKAA